MNWSSSFISVLKVKLFAFLFIKVVAYSNLSPSLQNLDPNYSVRYGKVGQAWTGEDADIFIKYGDEETEMPIWEYIETLQTSKHKLLKDHVLVITRIFDHRVKSFIKNILMGPGPDKLPIKYYTYRVEFQGESLTQHQLQHKKNYHFISAYMSNSISALISGFICTFIFTFLINF